MKKKMSLLIYKKNNLKTQKYFILHKNNKENLIKKIKKKKN